MTRQFRMIDGVLKDRDFIAGDYSIADIALFPWLRMEKRLGQDFADYPNIRRWHDTIAVRPAVAKAITTLADRAKTTALSDEDRSVLFGGASIQPAITLTMACVTSPGGAVCRPASGRGMPV